MASAINRNAFTFYAKHPALTDLSTMIAGDFASSEWNVKINFYVGLHEWDKIDLQHCGMNVGIQTEQYYDYTGRRLWACPSLYFVYRQLKNFDIVLDLNRSNVVAYRFFPERLRRKVLFGPYIFPSKERQFAGPTSGTLLFVGDINVRRKETLDAMQSAHNICVVKNTYGYALGQMIESSAGILNIHYASGLYTEWPRYLMAYLSGKVLYSEPLGPPLVVGRHYLPIEYEGPEGQGDEIFRKINEEIASQFKFKFFANKVMERLTSLR